MIERTRLFIGYDHVPEKMVDITAPISELAHKMEKLLPDNPQRALGMQKLLEAKDCFMRARLTTELTPLGTDGK